MPAYAVTVDGEPVLVEDAALTLNLGPHWLTLSDAAGIAYAVPTARVTAVERVDTQQEPAPGKE